MLQQLLQTRPAECTDGSDSCTSVLWKLTSLDASLLASASFATARQQTGAQQRPLHSETPSLLCRCSQLFWSATRLRWLRSTTANAAGATGGNTSSPASACKRSSKPASAAGRASGGNCATLGSHALPSQGQLASWPWSRRSANAAPACQPAAGESGCAGKQCAQHRKSLTSAGKLSNAQWHQPGTGGSASRSHQAGHLFHVLQAQPRRQDKAELCAAGLRGHIPQSERITLLRVGRASLCLMAVRTALRLKAAPAASAHLACEHVQVGVGPTAPRALDRPCAGRLAEPGGRPEGLQAAQQVAAVPGPALPRPRASRQRRCSIGRSQRRLRAVLEQGHVHQAVQGLLYARRVHHTRWGGRGPEVGTVLQPLSMHLYFHGNMAQGRMAHVLEVRQVHINNPACKMPSFL